MEQDQNQMEQSLREGKAILSLLQFQEISAENDNWQHRPQKINAKRGSNNSHLFCDSNKKNSQREQSQKQSFLNKVSKYRDNAILMKNYLARFKRANSLLEGSNRFRNTYNNYEPRTPKIFPQTMHIFQQHQKYEILHGEDQRKKQMHFNNGHPSRRSTRSNHKQLEKSLELDKNQKLKNISTNDQCVLLKVQSYQQTLNKRQKQYWKQLNIQTSNFYPKLSEKKQFLFQNQKYLHFYEERNSNKHLVNELVQNPFFNKGALQNENRTDFKNSRTNNSLDLQTSLKSPHNSNDQMSVSIRYLLNSLNSSKKSNSKQAPKQKQIFSQTQRKFNFHVSKPIQFDKDKLIKMYDSKQEMKNNKVQSPSKLKKSIETKDKIINHKKEENQKVKYSQKNENKKFQIAKINENNKQTVNALKNQIILVQEVSVREGKKKQSNLKIKKQKLNISSANRSQVKQVYNQNFRVIKL